MNKKLNRFVLTGSSALLITTLLFSPQASASTLNDLNIKEEQKEEQKEVGQKNVQLMTEIKKAANEIQSNQIKQDKLLNEILALNKEIVTTEEKMTNLQAKINQTNIEIEELQNDIKKLEKQINNRHQLVEERLRAVQESGGSIHYIDVLLGANSFVDFIDRFSAASTLMEADQSIVDEQTEDKKALEEKEAQFRDKLIDLEKSHDELVSLKTTLDSQKEEKTTLIDELEAEQAKLKQEIVADYAEVFQISDELTEEIREAQEWIATLAQTENHSESANLPAMSSGIWTAPTSGTFTSTYGYRTFDNSNHLGVDIANAVGTPIVAAADGIVSYAGPLAGFGNLVMITHSVDGQTFITLYGHLSSYNVEVGQKVTKGEQIADMGSTGNSTGPHLHFEVHVDSWDWQGSTSVNPLRYVPF